MRWHQEGVDFEPAGKDHHSEGGSFDTGRKIVKEVYDGEAPVSFQYDFIRIKGRGGKISSSSGEVVGLSEVLEIYQPEIVRYLFAGTRPNSEFAISFDLDVLKIYEDYDKCERIYFGKQEVGEKKRQKESRIYELSQVHAVPETMPVQLPFRHLCNLLQINGGDIETVLALFELDEEQQRRMRVRAQCAWSWITRFSPEEFRFRLQTAADPAVEIDEQQQRMLQGLKGEVEKLDEHDEKSFGTAIYDVARSEDLEPKDLFSLVYMVLIGKEKGPRLAGFIMTVGKQKVLEILSRYV